MNYEFPSNHLLNFNLIYLAAPTSPVLTIATCKTIREAWERSIIHDAIMGRSVYEGLMMKVGGLLPPRRRPSAHVSLVPVYGHEK